MTGPGVGMLDTELASLNAADRGFLTWVAGMLREDVEEVFERLLGTVEHGPGTRVVDGRLVSLDLSVIGPQIRWLVGPSRPLGLPVAGLEALEWLDCSGMDLDLLDVGALPALKVLRCADNRLKQLDLSQSTSLEVLDCAGNDLMLLDVRACVDLRVLDCTGNALGALVLDDGSRLERLCCGRNQLMVLRVGDQPELREILAYRNALAAIDLGDCPKLRHLDVSRNEIDELDLPALPALERLVCGRNRLAALDPSASPLLRELYAQGNYVDRLDLAGHARLERVDLRANQLVELGLGAHPMLTEVLVSDNRLEALDLSGAPSLEVLRCAGNELEQLDLSGLPALCLLDCSDNRLGGLDPSPARGLAELLCDDNPLRRLDIRYNPELCRLRTASVRGEAPEVLATEIQRHRLAELRERFGLASGSREVAAMSSWELHDLAVSLDGRDAEGTLLEVVRQPQCDLGTALMIYWMSAPHYYGRYERRDELESYEARGWDLLEEIEARIASGFYTRREIWFDPRNDKQTRSVRGYDWTRDDTLVPAPTKRRIPEVLMRPSLPAP